jgi:hypothetical protein
VKGTGLGLPLRLRRELNADAARLPAVALTGYAWTEDNICAFNLRLSRTPRQAIRDCRPHAPYPHGRAESHVTP